METSMLVYCLIALSVFFLVLAFAYFSYAGLFEKVIIGAGKPPIQNVTIAYKYGRGAYNNCYSVFSETASIAPSSRCMGLYYDDPKQVPAEKLRWAVGTIISEGDELPDQNLVDAFQSKGFYLFFLPAVTNAVRTSFPNRTSLSLLIAIFKVYPLLAEYVKMNRLCAHPFIEIYADGLIHFMAPLAKQDEFYVHEAILHGLQPEGADEDLPPVPEEGTEPPTDASPWECGVGQPEGGVKYLQTDDSREADNLSQPMAQIDGSGDRKVPLVSNEDSSGKQSDSVEVGKDATDKARSSSMDSAQSSLGENKENLDANIMKGGKASAAVSRRNPYQTRSGKKEHLEGAFHLEPLEGPVLAATGQTFLHQMPPSPGFSCHSDSSALSTTTDDSSVASFYTSQSEMSYTSGSQNEFSDSDVDTEKEDCGTENCQTDHDRAL